MPKIDFHPYMHVERLGTDPVNGILQGHCCISTKLDGTSAVVWLDDGIVRVGTRNRVITPENDHMGCAKYVSQQPKFRAYLEKYPTHVLYGEFLVKQSIKTYDATAWHKIYVFDVFDVTTKTYLPYEDYVAGLKEFGLEYIPPIAIIDTPTEKDLEECLENSTFLNNGAPGEGIVIHNVDFRNAEGRTVFAKVVRKEYKTRKYTPDINKQTVEEAIVEKFCTPSFIEKEYQKLITELGGWQSKYIGRFLGTTYHTFIQEECWNFIKEFHGPIVDFRLLNHVVVDKIKEVKSEIF